MAFQWMSVGTSMAPSPLARASLLILIKQHNVIAGSGANMMRSYQTRAIGAKR